MSKQIIKELKKYQKSESFEQLKEYCQKEFDKLTEKNRNILRNRDKIDLNYSYMNAKQAEIDSLLDIIERAENDVFCEYLKKRVEAHQSSIDNSLVTEESNYSDVDINKLRRQEYWAVWHYLDYCIAEYEKSKNKSPDDELNPY